LNAGDLLEVLIEGLQVVASVADLIDNLRVVAAVKDLPEGLWAVASSRI
jgi:hypothetical protein